MRLFLAKEDWEADCKGFKTLNRHRMEDCYFTLADRFTSSLAVGEYIAFLNRLLTRIVRFDASSGEVGFKSEEEIFSLGDKDPLLNENNVFQFKSLEEKEAEAKERKQQLSKLKNSSAALLKMGGSKADSDRRKSTGGLNRPATAPNKRVSPTLPASQHLNKQAGNTVGGGSKREGPRSQSCDVRGGQGSDKDWEAVDPYHDEGKGAGGGPTERDLRRWRVLFDLAVERRKGNSLSADASGGAEGGQRRLLAEAHVAAASQANPPPRVAAGAPAASGGGGGGGEPQQPDFLVARSDVVGSLQPLRRRQATEVFRDLPNSGPRFVGEKKEDLEAFLEVEFGLPKHAITNNPKAWGLLSADTHNDGGGGGDGDKNESATKALTKPPLATMDIFAELFGLLPDGPGSQPSRDTGRYLTNFDEFCGHLHKRRRQASSAKVQGEEDCPSAEDNPKSFLGALTRVGREELHTKIDQATPTQRPKDSVDSSPKTVKRRSSAGGHPGSATASGGKGKQGGGGGGGGEKQQRPSSAAAALSSPTAQPGSSAVRTAAENAEAVRLEDQRLAVACLDDEDDDQGGGTHVRREPTPLRRHLYQREQPSEANEEAHQRGNRAAVFTVEAFSRPRASDPNPPLSPRQEPPWLVVEARWRWSEEGYRRGQ